AMDDLLITRRSDRSRARFATRRHGHAPLGANLGLLLGAAFGLLFLAMKQEAGSGLFAGTEMQALSGYALTAGIAGGLAVGGLLGFLLKRGVPRRRQRRPNLYEGFPISPEQEADE